MFLKELGIFLLFYIQVSSAEIYLGLALLGVKPGPKKILTIGLIHGFTMFVVRYTYSVLGIPLGSHFIFSILSFTLASRYVAGVGWGLSIAAMLIGSISTIFSEALLFPVYLKYMNISGDEMLSSLWLHVLGGYFGSLLIFMLAFIVGISEFSLLKPDKTENLEIGE